MSNAISVLVLVAAIGGYIAYTSWLTKGIQPREFETSIPAVTLRSMFEERVVRAGWKLVDDGNPLVAQSSLLTGIRQQISLSVTAGGDGRTAVRVGPERWVTKWGVPKKGHTIRMRLNSFLDEVRAHDPAITVSLAPLRGR